MPSSTLTVLIVVLLAVGVLALVLVRAMRSQIDRGVASALATAQGALVAHNEARIGNAESTIRQQVGDFTAAITKLREETAKLEQQRNHDFGAVFEATKTTQSALQRLNDETAKLGSALRGGKARGNWGETTLHNLLESLGMTEYVDFDEQKQEVADGNKRPDVTIKLPGQRVLYIDSKAIGDNYFRAIDEQDPAAKSAHLKDHEADMRASITDLAKRGYHLAVTQKGEYRENPSANYVVMYVPIEAALVEALKVNPALLDFAAAQNVVIASPVSLIVILNNVRRLWRDDETVRNVQHILAETNVLAQRIIKFVSYIESVGGALASTVAKYNEAVSSFNSRVLPAAREVNKRSKDFSLDALTPVPGEPSHYKQAPWLDGGEDRELDPGRDDTP